MEKEKEEEEEEEKECDLVAWFRARSLGFVTV